LGDVVVLEAALNGPPVRYEVLDARELEGGQFCPRLVQRARSKVEALQRQAGGSLHAFTRNDKSEVVEPYPDAVGDVVVP